MVSLSGVLSFRRISVRRNPNRLGLGLRSGVGVGFQRFEIRRNGIRWNETEPTFDALEWDVTHYSLSSRPVVANMLACVHRYQCTILLLNHKPEVPRVHLANMFGKHGKVVKSFTVKYLMLICWTFVTFVSNSTLTITSTALYLVQQISHSHRL